MERNIKKLNLYSKEYKNMVWDNFLVVNLSFLVKLRSDNPNLSSIFKNDKIKIKSVLLRGNVS
jgi:hypothetical protein